MADRRRRKIFSKFQHQLAVRIIAYWIIYQFTLFNCLFCWHLLQDGVGNIFDQYSLFLGEFIPMLFCFLLLIPLFMWDATRFYHRITGPLVQFRRVMKDVSHERPARLVRLRGNGELYGMQDDFNDMMISLAKRGAVTLINADLFAAKKDSEGDEETSASDRALVTRESDAEDQVNAAG